MTTELTSPQLPDALDELIGSLLDCGGVLSQLIGGMVAWEASGRSDPDAVPIPEVAHSLIRGVAKPVAHGHSKRDIKVAAKIVAQMTDQICEEIYTVDPEWFDAVQAQEASGEESQEASGEEAREPSGEQANGDTSPESDQAEHAVSRGATAEIDHGTDDDINAFILQLLNTGRMLSGLLPRLAEMLPADDYPGEEPETVALGMLCGSIRTVLEQADGEDLRRAAALIDQAGERTLEHLELALALSRRMNEGGENGGRTYG